MGKIPKDQTGAALVEFALMLPLFLALLFGVVEFALIMHTKGTITQASQAGARFGAVYSSPPKSTGEIQAYVLNYLQHQGLTEITGGGIVVTTNPSPPAISVRVVYPYHFVVLPGFADVELTAESICRSE